MSDALDILIVEDDPSDLELTRRCLQSETKAITIEAARDGEEALDFLFCRNGYSGRSRAVQPKVVLLDLKLPKLHGLEVLREIKSKPETHDIPVVLFTSSSQERDLLDGYRLGANGYVQKPTNFNLFRKTIMAIRQYWLDTNQRPVLAPD